MRYTMCVLGLALVIHTSKFAQRSGHHRDQVVSLQLKACQARAKSHLRRNTEPKVSATKNL